MAPEYLYRLKGKQAQARIAVERRILAVPDDGYESQNRKALRDADGLLPRKGMLAWAASRRYRDRRGLEKRISSLRMATQTDA